MFGKCFRISVLLLIQILQICSISAQYNASWSCGGVLTQIFGEIRKEPYLDNEFCEWRIVGHNLNDKIEINVGHLEIENNYDYLYGFEEHSNEMIFNLTGKNKVPLTFLSKGNSIKIIFTSDDSVKGSGFLLKYNIIQVPSTCGGSLTGNTGEIRYLQYPENANCEWRIITRNPQDRLKINFEGKFDLENNYDFLIGFDESSGTELFKLTGNVLPSTQFQTNGNPIRINFSSDKSKNGFGFKLSYQVISGHCGEFLTAKTGEISLPSYLNNQTCEWTIAPENSGNDRIEIKFQEKFDLEENFDFLAGYDESSKRILFNLTGNKMPSPIISEGHPIKIRFISDHSKGGYGFKFVYKALSVSSNPKCRFENPLERIDCGFSGISKIECESKDCCFDDRVIGVKNCFYHTHPSISDNVIDEITEKNFIRLPSGCPDGTGWACWSDSNTRDMVTHARGWPNKCTFTKYLVLKCHCAYLSIQNKPPQC